MTRNITKTYLTNKSAHIGQELSCPACGSRFVKKHYQQAFCKTRPGTQCKDKYWNTVDPTKRNNTTRISPASKAWIDRQKERRDRSVFYDDDQGWDAHKDSF